MTKIKLVRIEKKKAFLIKCAKILAAILVLFFIFFNKVRIYNASGNLVLCFKKIPKQGDVICYKTGKVKKVAVFDSIRNDSSYRLYSKDKKNVISEYVYYDNYKGIVKFTIPFIFSMLHSKLFLLLLLVFLIFLYRKNEELNNRKLNRKSKKNEIT